SLAVYLSPARRTQNSFVSRARVYSQRSFRSAGKNSLGSVVAASPAVGHRHRKISYRPGLVAFPFLVPRFPEPDSRPRLAQDAEATGRDLSRRDRWKLGRRMALRLADQAGLDGEREPQNRDVDLRMRRRSNHLRVPDIEPLGRRRNSRAFHGIASG